MKLQSKHWPTLQSFEDLAFRKALLCMQCFLSPTQLRKEWALILEHPRDKEPTHPVLGLSLCVGKSFLISCLVSTFSSLHKACVSYGTWLTPVFYPSPSERGQVLPLQHEVDLALSFLYVNKVVFHPVLDWVVFSFMTPIPRCSGQKCLGPSLGIGN